MAMVTIENLTFKYKDGKENALDKINLIVEKGDFLGIIGESGAGKSTLTYAINGIIPHHFQGDYYGSVKIEGEDVFDKTLTEISLKIGSVLQDISGQMVSSVVEDEILYALENFNIPRDEIETRISSSLEQTGISELRYRTIDSLSGGQKQKVIIAAIIAVRPKVLLLDEPTSELDPKSSVQIFQILKELNEKYGITIIVVEQKIMLLSEFVSKLAVMSHGSIIFNGPVRDVMKNSTELEKYGINCPRVATLSNKLKDMGVNIDKVCINVDEAEEMIRRLIHG
jgi:energy-coupling factor transporter ATP-binding protein EcfA2